MMTFCIPELNRSLEGSLKQKIDLKTKPIGALGDLESLALRIGLIQQSLSPSLNNPHILVFAGDHGIAKENLVNPYPQEVTYQMVMNFLEGGAAINVFARQHQLALEVIDAGVNHDFGDQPHLIHAKIAKGTANYLNGPAMTLAQCQQAMQKGAELVDQVYQRNCNVIGFGEMGISNTSSAALIMHTIMGLPLEDCVGKGTGANNSLQKTKLQTLDKVIHQHNRIDKKNPIQILSTFGGFEIAQLCGAMLQAASRGMIILVDGFITSAALLIAEAIDAHVLSYCIFTHCSDEKGHAAMLDHFKAIPLLQLGMRLGEGSGAALAYPIVASACAFLNEMASFDSAGVSKENQ
ncbi:nicotinate-nucleotide--dimethylbenzimidazole phosphoribosyltransferase [Echinicola vietnamensis]|uniref:Nicotinate-nucleotide--dimethylbenzimidazole phosphoribosyltransferase n=1 Tax=Echinicola vietnamensis (strain DSM 17526 / LMG 23754 / KMM 6221) TaxID=926556 RepID=L0G4N2_ECHVK|nr:nicotinate-nucleotide--dimethylbenzimidazole phosphoribosyltransferase [Echinicola vietnamensis]AGA79971.1 nicotinate-nucleotide--dimethylbenzimidazole phosphoribosyltransferase [Echinicola vietnamensis DSM 17526]